MLVGFDPQYVRSRHLLYLTRGDGGMMALPFDGETLQVLGGPTPILEGVRKEETGGFGHFAVSESGTLVYAPGVNAHRGYLGYVDRAGSVDTLKAFGRDQFDWLALSPNGEKLLIGQRPEEGGPGSTWVLNLPRGFRDEMEIDSTVSISPWSWIDDDRFIFVRSDPITHSLIGLSEYSLQEDLPRAIVEGPYSWPALDEAGGRLLVSHMIDHQVELLSWPEGARLSGAPEEKYAHSISPNGLWHAWSEPGAQIFAALFPFSGPYHQITDGFSEQPRWSPSGDALFYRWEDQFWRVPFQPDEESPFGDAELFAEGNFVRVWAWTYAVTADNRILTVIGPPEKSTDQLVVVTNFFEELRQKTER
jgi:hypothetical protein